jgi:hypothetical protein
MVQLLLEHDPRVTVEQSVWVGPDGKLYNMGRHRYVHVDESNMPTLSAEAEAEIAEMWASFPPVIVRDFSVPNKPQLRAIPRR